MLKLFKDTRRGVFLLDKTEIKIFQVWIGTLGGYQSVIATKLEILIHLTFQSMRGKLHFKNGVTAYDVGT